MSQPLASCSPLVASVLCCTLSPVAAAEQAEGTRNFNLPRGDAATTLGQFARASGQQIVYMMDKVRGEQTNAVVGEFSPREALQRMLTGTALVARQDGATGAFVIRRLPQGDIADEPAPSGPAQKNRPTGATEPRMKRANPIGLIMAWLGLTLAPAQAQDAAAGSPGTITGRIFNPATGEYVRNAQVRVAGRPEVSISEEGGEFRLTGLAPGEVTVVVSYTGYQPASAKVHVTPGATVNRDFELKSVLEGPNTLKLDAVVVSSTREGDAKAIMEQRTSMNIVNSVASDVFGDNVDGNIGEFLKHLPGVDTFRVAGEIRNVGLRGLTPEYTSITLNGLPLVNADSAAGDSRAFSFEQASLNSVESIEVMKTVSADVDANAPAGTINLRPKNAFDRRGRRTSAQVTLSAFSEEFHLRRTQGPDDARSRKLLPGGVIEYSDIFFNRRLGLVLNLSHSEVYSSFSEAIMSNSLTAAPTAADPRPGVVTFVRLFDGPRTNEKSAVTFTADYRATSNLSFGLNVIYSTAELWYCMRSATFNAGARGAIQGDLTDFTSATTGTVQLALGNISKLGTTVTAQPRFEYKRGNLTINGILAMGRSKSWYEPFKERRSAYSMGAITMSGVQFRAQRSSAREVDWKITQIAGRDWSDGANYTAPDFNIDDGRTAIGDVATGQITATLETRKVMPVVWKTGLKMNQEVRDFSQLRDSYLFQYRNGVLGAWAPFRSATKINSGAYGASETSLSGGSVFLPDVLAIADAYISRPSDFNRVFTATNYYNAYLGNKKHYVEDINAGFAMATAQLRKLTLRAGLRWEETRGNSREFNVRPPAEVVAAGFPVAAGRATTIPGLEYQYLSRPKVDRKSSYDNLFPSAALKFKFNDSFDFHVGYSETIRRPTWQNITGIWSPNDTAGTVTAPNPGLKPEQSDNLSARLSYYFEPIGILAVSVYQNEVEGLHLSSRLTAEEYGYEGSEYRNYTFVTTANSANKTKIRGLEFEYRQTLSFLPGPLGGLSVRTSYTRNTSEVVNPGMAPYLINGGLNYTFRGLSLNTAVNYSGDIPTVANGTGYTEHRWNFDLGGSYQVSRRTSVFLAGRNVTNSPYITLQRVGQNPRTVSSYRKWGGTWTFGMKVVF